MTHYPAELLQIKALLERENDAPVRLHETSKSWIFLGDKYVYKLKKRVRDDLQDLTSLRARFDNCLTEIDLNRRLAPETYLGALRISRSQDGQLGLGGPDKTVDWLIKMRRLPRDRMLDEVATDCTSKAADLQLSIAEVAERLSAFYATSPVSNLNARELATIIFDQHERNSACLMHPLFKDHHPRFAAVLETFKTAFDKHYDLFEARVTAGLIRECHGDLRPEHICLTAPPVIFDCLEFNRNLRLIDPFSEVTFLGMETKMLGVGWIKAVLFDGLTSNISNCPDPRLLGLHEAMHALLRTRTCLAHLLVPTPRTPEKWLPLGLRYLEFAERQLCSQDGLLR